MIIARLRRAVRDQDWFAALLEFIIVISGVVIGFQITAIAQAAQNKNSLVTALEQMATEVETNIRLSDETVERIDTLFPRLDTLLRAIESCTPPEDGFSGLEATILTLGADFTAGLETERVARLVDHPGFSPHISEEAKRNILGYRGALIENRAQSATNFELMWANHVMLHPGLGLRAPDGFDTLGLDLETGFYTLCEDTSFQNRLLSTIAFISAYRLRYDLFSDEGEETAAAIQAELEALR